MSFCEKCERFYTNGFCISDTKVQKILYHTNPRWPYDYKLFIIHYTQYPLNKLELLKYIYFSFDVHLLWIFVILHIFVHPTATIFVPLRPQASLLFIALFYSFVYKNRFELVSLQCSPAGCFYVLLLLVTEGENMEKKKETTQEKWRVTFTSKELFFVGKSPFLLPPFQHLPGKYQSSLSFSTCLLKIKWNYSKKEIFVKRIKRCDDSKSRALLLFVSQ